MIEAAAPDRSTPIVDIGGGICKLVDELLQVRHPDVIVLGLSTVALDRSKARLESKAAAVDWIVADITTGHLVVRGIYGMTAPCFTF